MKRRILELLRQGITPEKVALTIALGITLGVTPVVGSTSLLCALAAMRLRLNLPLIQLVNYFVYPAQLALLIPFLRTGEWILGAPRFPISLAQIFALIRASVWNAFITLWSAALHALLAWLLVGSVATVVLYLLLAPTLRQLSAESRRASCPPQLPS